jgi:multicomponent K+:H+ antiporter subunit A
MFQRDLKALLAYSTISHLGLITLLLGLNSPLAAVAAVFHVMNHATFKASLFMAAGIIDHETGTRDIRKLSGLMRLMPITGTLAIIASASMAGVPLLNGFLSKEMFFAETVFIQATPWVDWSLPVIATIAGIFSVAYSARFVFDVFFGPPCGDEVPKHPHEPPHWMRVPVELLVLVCLVVGVAPAWSVGPLLAAAATPVVGGTLPEYSLAVWHGFNLPLMMSFVALAGGTALYLLQRRQRARGWPRTHAAAAPLRRPGHLRAPAGAAERSLGRRSRRLFGTRRMQSQLLLLVAVAVVGAAASLWATPAAPGTRELLPFSPMFAMMWLIGGTCALAAAWQAKFHRLAALMLASGAGLVSCVTYIWFSAPDLALTQLVVEAVTTVLILLGLRWLPMRSKDVIQPARARLRPWGRRGRDLLVAAIAGGGMAALAWAMMTRTFPQSISPFFLERALTEGGGTNVVNVMLVDFRGFDTFGEITVLGIVALTVYALLRRFRPAIESMALPVQQRQQVDDGSSDLLNPRRAKDTAVGYLMVPAVLVRLLLPLAVLVSVYFFMRGHNAPGGGFVAGLVMSVALVLQFIVSGTEWVEEHLRIYPRYWIAIGLLFALCHGQRRGGLRLPLPDHAHRAPASAGAGRDPRAQRPVLRHRRVRAGARRHHADPHRPGPPVDAQPPLGRRTGRKRSAGRGRSRGGSALMEIVLALAIGVLTGSGVYMLLRPRTFQVIMGLTLISYAVNLFIFSMGRLKVDSEPVLIKGIESDAGQHGRPDAAGAGAHGHRHRLRHDGPVPGGHAGLARPHRHRPCGR